jgi:hypothetical protein
MKTKPKTVTDKLLAEILHDLAELRALREELENTPPPGDPLDAFRAVFRDGLKELEQDEAQANPV